jgi:two-component system, cell cycle sensor histidine kinase and response regulator CckA
MLCHVLALEASARKSADLIRQLLAFSQKQIMDLKIMNVNDMLESFKGTIVSLLGSSIDFQIKPGRGLWMICMDPSQVDQIVMNLVMNARDAVASGGSIKIETSNLRIGESNHQGFGEIPSGEYVQLTVSDSGVGISREVLGKIFDPFFTTKERGKGTGLGLSTVFGIVKQNEGFIDVQSELGRGTTFRIFLPRYRGELPEPETEAFNVASKKGEGVILVVEDDEILRGVIPRVLGRLGYDFILADTPGEALNVCHQAGVEIDVLLTDVVMPGMSGKELWDIVQQLHPKTKVIFMSGYTADAISERGVLGASVHFLQKPFTTAELGLKLKTVMDGSREAR